MTYTAKLYLDLIVKNDKIELSDANRFQNLARKKAQIREKA